MLQIILAILAFGALVVVHEFGHFITAKRGGVQVNEFWIGMGPTLLSKTWHGTKYCLKLLPFGGACVMEGEDGDYRETGNDAGPRTELLDTDTWNASKTGKAFPEVRLRRRMLIVVAGALMNFIVGYLIVVALTAMQPILVSTTIEGFEDGFAAEGETMLLPGDKILSVEGYHVLEKTDFSNALAQNGAEGKFDITVQRDGKKVELTGVPLTRAFTDEYGNKLYGITFAELDKNPVTVMGQAGLTSLNYARLVWSSLGQLVTGQVGVDQLSGPVGVAEVMAGEAKRSMASFFNLVAFISINLGVMNLLPLPALDGGRLVFLVLEGIRRKPVPAKYEGYVHAAGLLLLLALMVYVTGQDIWRIATRG